MDIPKIKVKRTGYRTRNLTLKMYNVIKLGLWATLVCVLNAYITSSDTYRLVKPLNQELVDVLHVCDVGCLTMIDVGDTHGSEMYEVEGTVTVHNCKYRCSKYNITVRDGQMTPLVSKISFKGLDCKVFGKEAPVTVPWNIRKLPPSYTYGSNPSYPYLKKSRPITSMEQINNIPNDNVKNKVPGIVLRLDCLKSDGSIVPYSIVYGQFETLDGKMNTKRSSSSTNRTIYPNKYYIMTLIVIIHIILLLF